jgi:hypothetical protein
LADVDPLCLSVANEKIGYRTHQTVRCARRLVVEHRAPDAQLIT